MGITELITRLSDNSALVTFIVAMVPVLELRGAIPLGVSLGLSHGAAFAWSVLGNMVPVPLIIVFVRRVFAFLRRHWPFLEHIITRMERRAARHHDFIHKWQLFGLALLVAIPLPGTGAWTGALIAALMDIRLRRAMPAIFLGVIVAGILVTGIVFGFRNILPF
jgi:uncharacterized membrane protein